MKAGWTYRKLGDVCDIIGGGTPAKNNEQFYRNGTIPWATVRDMKSEEITDTEFKITPVAVNSSSTNIVPKGNIVIATRVGLGKACLLAQDTAINQDLKGFIPKNRSKLLVGYLFQWFKNNAQMIQAQGTGATVQGVKLPFIKSLIIPIPPIEEQQRIISIVDQAFDAIATAKANAEKNLKNAREIFESHLNAVFTQRGEGWVETNLAKEVDLLTGFAFKSKEYTDATDGIKLLRGDNIIQGVFRWEDVKKWPKSDADTYAKFSLAENDIVLAMDRTWVKAGLKYAQISQSDLPCLLVQRVARIRTKEGLDSTFLKHLIGSNEFTRYVLSIQTGLGVPHISGKQIKDFTFSKPTIAIQKDLANKIGGLQAQIQRLKYIYQQKLAALDELKKSLLHQAFTGELTSLPDKQLDEALP